MSSRLVWSSRADHSREAQPADRREVGRERLRLDLARLARRPRPCARWRPRASCTPSTRFHATAAPSRARPTPADQRQVGAPRVIAGGLVDEAERPVHVPLAAVRPHRRPRPGYPPACASRCTSGRAATRPPRRRPRRQRQLDRAWRLHRPGGARRRGALEQRPVRQRHRPPALRHAGDARVAHAEHQLGPVDGHVAPALERPPARAASGIRPGGSGRSSARTAAPRIGQRRHRGAVHSGLTGQST